MTTIRQFLSRALILICFLALLFGLLPEAAKAGGPKFIAGTSFFNAGLAGQSITWPGGTITYYTDQGDLSPLLQGTNADAFIADAFSRWTSIPTAAVSANRGGQLAENVSGANVVLNSDRSMTLPADIQPSATGKPVGIVYDFDGTVTDTLLGTGASSDCLNNSAFGGPDAFTADGHFAHALVIANGLCAQTSAQLPDMKYHLVRVFGEVLGLDWSQLNLNVITGSPHPTTADQAGFPVMHATDSISCVPISLCYANADQTKLDDQAALARLYPVTTQNAGQFSGKQVSSTAAASIHGSVRFTDAHGNPVQPMQGVNVVARWIDPSSGQPSRQYAVSSVSGFAFSGNAGSPLTGSLDALGQPLNRFGSSDTTLEGSFDLAGLVIPGGSTGQFQLTVEALDSMLSQQVGPYAPYQVLPSGTAQPVTVTLSTGADVQQDILMQCSAIARTDLVGTSTFASPLPVPKSGLWTGDLSSYGEVDYVSLNAQSGQTAVIDVTALDESSQATEQKAQPLIGAWSISDTAGSLPPAVTSSPFNVGDFGVTRLNAQFLSSGQFRIGIGDLRGDGRPDYRYLARVLYADSLEPSRVGAGGGSPIEIDGIGFQNGMKVSIGNTNAAILSLTSDEIYVSAPAIADGIQSLAITDSASGASVSFINMLTIGAGPNDMIRLTQSLNPSVPVGGEAASAIRIAVTSADGFTPVSGATVHWSATNGATLTACKGASTCSVCSVFSDESGKLRRASTWAPLGRVPLLPPLHRHRIRGEIRASHCEWDIVVDRSGDLHSESMGCQGHNCRRAADHAAAVEWEPRQRWHDQFPGAAWFRNRHNAERQNGLHRICAVHAALIQPEFGRAGLGLRGPGEQSLPDVLCSLGRARRTATRKRRWEPAGHLGETVVPAGVAAGHGFIHAREPRARRHGLGSRRDVSPGR